MIIINITMTMTMITIIVMIINGDNDVIIITITIIRFVERVINHHKSWRGQKSEHISSKDPSQIRPKRSLKNQEILLICLRDPSQTRQKNPFCLVLYEGCLLKILQRQDKKDP